MPSQQRSDPTGERPLECAHCQYPIPGEATTADDEFYCSQTCREAAADGTTVPDPGAYKRIVTGVEPLDALVPAGVPATAFVRIAGEAGTRRTELLTELAWRTLERREPAVVVATSTPPTAILERFFENGWNVLPALEDDRLRIVDCFTHCLSDPEAVRERRSEWLAFVGEAAADAVDVVETPDEPGAVRTAVVEALDALEMTETGLVTVESLDALEPRFGTDGVREWCTELRAAVPKARYVPIFAGTAADGLDEGSIVFDGIVDLRLLDRLETETRRRQLAIGKLAGARHLPQWITYEYEPIRGLYAPGSTEDGRGHERRQEFRRDESQFEQESQDGRVQQRQDQRDRQPRDQPERYSRQEGGGQRPDAGRQTDDRRGGGPEHHQQGRRDEGGAWTGDPEFDRGEDRGEPRERRRSPDDRPRSDERRRGSTDDYGRDGDTGDR